MLKKKQPSKPGRDRVWTLQPPAWHQDRLYPAHPVRTNPNTVAKLRLLSFLGRSSGRQVVSSRFSGYFLSSSHEQGQAEQAGAAEPRTSIPVQRPETPEDAQVFPLQEPRLRVSSEGTQTFLQLERLPVSQV